ncbi:MULTISPECIES: SDR family NAD(P)-dependent oxidoreductase [unclassified Sphingobium]|uniref:SDR family NAD(P)-dependent oxidoreductase n=1 Tax=unclassified Sphingobium TaxID=2611147 RepID=UPI000D15B75B|nr:MULTISPECIES: SDR family NAD(P)-dependent oxidoreductase [unclassified Sphingobium]MBG6120049.1 NAD(P)-dependent dehydrogenase (short-subunit alcohol dehydrogenase family) [Sphingobium sp. JAI105]PSO12896.1 short-chain dehydrogenase [Sphingobium sp. AEW4]TWD05750.1 NAD(P)-dependent dehydrogenase (short-subunit alcohol dehydrogenase family) [Sphingobium sp. AEW010]TWD23303.1 NAD(P)-dependent dehydrogenase (short-subunit alcohol dehydrogenase family) [Sphingobium sp. AEW013]TWD25163.1 NAD(P)-
MARRFEGKVAVVTGAGRNIGRAEALLLASEGARVVVNDLGGGPNGDEPGNASFAQQVVDEIVAAGGEAVAEVSSVASMEGGAAIVQKAIDTWGRIDILINNAGIVRAGRIDQLEEKDFDLVVNVSLKGTFATVRAAAPHFIRQKSGVILNTGSTSGLGHYGMSNYSAAKEGVSGFSRSVARDLGEFGVRCNTLRPISAITGTRTPGVTETVKRTAELGQPLNWNRPMALRRLSPTPDQVAALAVWLCSDTAAHVSGRDFFVQGDEIGLLPEVEMIRTVFDAQGFDLESLDDPGVTEYLLGDIKNRFVRTD